MAAALTSITRIPYDAQNLPFSTVRFVKKDAAFEFNFQVPATRDHQLDQAAGIDHRAAGRRREGRRRPDGQDQRRSDSAGAAGDGRRRPRRRGARPRRATRRCTSSTTWRRRASRCSRTTRPRPRQPRWASLSPDSKTILFARNHNLYMMDAENYAKALKNPNDTTIVETQLTTDGEDYYGYSARSGGRGNQDDQQQQQQQQQQDDNEQQQEQREDGDAKNARVARGQRHLVARLEPVLARPPRRPQGEGPVGHQPAGQSASDARDLSLRDARRGEHAAVGDLRVRRQGEEPRQDQGGSLQGSDRQHRDAGRSARGAGAGGGGRRRRRRRAADAARGRRSGSATAPTSSTSRASAATCTASTSASPTRRPAR